jgi:hypothetical protein
MTVRPKQIAAEGATEGQVLAFDAATGSYEPRTPIVTDTATATANTTTSSVGDVLMDSMTLTPGAGTYLVLFGADLDGGEGENGEGVISIYANGVQATASEKTGHVKKNRIGPGVMTHAIVTVADAQAIEGRWRSDDGDDIGAFGRRLELIRIPG